MFSSLFFRFSPLLRFVVKEKSMEPYIKEGEIILVLKYFFTKPRVGDTIIFHHTTPPYTFIKRIIKFEKNKFWVEGDNKKESYDSRKFGYIKKRDIFGKMIFKM